MKNSELILELQKLDPQAEVIINVKQNNKAYGRQLPIFWVDGSYNGCTITTHLPKKAIISNWPSLNPQP